MGEIGGAIQRVNVPAELGPKTLTRAFFTKDSVLRKGLTQPFADQLFAGPVSHRHQVHITLVLSLDALRKEFTQPRPGLAGNRRRLRNPYPLPRHRNAAHEEASSESFTSGQMTAG